MGEKKKASDASTHLKDPKASKTETPKAGADLAKGKSAKK